MGKGTYSVSAKARCPYYRSEQRAGEVKLRCDGALPGTWLHLCFDSRQDMLCWRDRCCKGDWERCPVARMLGSR